MDIPNILRKKGSPRGLFLGLTTVDIIFGLEKYPEEDSKSRAKRLVIAAGGPATNAAVIFSRLGGDPVLYSSLGKSSIAEIAGIDLVMQGVKHEDIAENIINVKPAISAIVISEENGSRTIFTTPQSYSELSGAAFGSEDIIEPAGFDILLLDGHEEPLAVNVARKAKDSGTAIVLDGDCFRPAMINFLPFVDIVIYGKSFAVPGIREEDDIFKYLESFGIRNIIATHGGDSVEFLVNGNRGRFNVEPVKVVDTLAAGDFFHGAFCYFYSIGHDIIQSLKLAMKVAGLSVTMFGTRDWLKECDLSGFKIQPGSN